jgi:hypothetical protein
LIRIRNFVNGSVSLITGGPAETGRIAEFVAAQIFDIELAAIFVNKAIDGWFSTSTPLAGRSVNVKYRSSSSKRLNIENSPLLADHPDYYLAFRGPGTSKEPTSEKMLPFVIEAVYLFASRELIPALVSEGGATIGPSVKTVHWQAAMIYPQQVNQVLILTDEQRAALALFAPRG